MCHLHASQATHFACESEEIESGEIWGGNHLMAPREHWTLIRADPGYGIDVVSSAPSGDFVEQQRCECLVRLFILPGLQADSPPAVVLLQGLGSVSYMR